MSGRRSGRAPRLRSGQAPRLRSGQGKGAHLVAPDADDFDDLLEYVAELDVTHSDGAQSDGAQTERFVNGLTTPVRRRIFDAWRWQAHGGQRVPAAFDGTGPGDCRVWLVMAGRGFGKTRAGAQWVSARAREDGRARIALVGGSADEVAKVMIEGPSGLLSVARTGEAPTWLPTRRQLLFPSGAQAFVYSAEAPGKLRGPEHHFAWCDELAKWAHADAAWDNLMLGLRLGERPRAMVTTTPQPVPLLKRIEGMHGRVTTRGRTGDNVHLPESFVDAVTGMYAGTRLGRQELDGELIEDVEGALFSRGLIEACRVPPFLPGTGWGTMRSMVEGALHAHCGSPGPLHQPSAGPPPRAGEDFSRIVIGVDPPAGVDGAACGIVVAGARGGVFYVLADESVAGLSPEGWAAAVARAAARWRADRVVAEANQGGRMVESVLRAVERHLPLKLVHASEGKVKRAEPVAALFERGGAKFAGAFPELEDELAGLTVGGGYQGPGGSPDRADACVWALTELMAGAGRAEPRIRVL
jgi:phage terminase large subunit-like protein